jgi:hypothetical protein
MSCNTSTTSSTFPNFANMQSIYNSQMDLMLSSTGLTTKCQLNFGVSKPSLCPNCIFDVNLKKSANKYKSGGPLDFQLGTLCPYCNGIGYFGETTTEDIYLAIISDQKKWINPPVNVAITDNMIQAIGKKTYLESIKQCKDMTIIYSTSNTNPKFTLYTAPTLVGLGDNNYIITMWKNI